MNIIKPGAAYMPHDCTPQQFIERIGRTCYKSEDKITEGSAERFVAGLIKSKHWAMLEHETVYTVMEPKLAEIFLLEMFHANIPTDFLVTTYNGNHLESLPTVISGSIRAFYDIFSAYYPEHDNDRMPCIAANWMFGEIKDLYPWAFQDIPDPLIKVNRNNGSPLNRALTREQFCERFACEPNILRHHLTHTVKFTVDRGVTHEFCRHRRTSYAMESTRYCNYVKGKYGSEITVIKPCFYEEGTPAYTEWADGCKQAEETYMRLTDQEGLNRKAEEARDNLPHSVKADLIMTATEEQWQHFIDLRADGTTGKPHPQAQEAAKLWADILEKESNGRVGSHVKAN